jgi:hypothetical protein
MLVRVIASEIGAKSMPMLVLGGGALSVKKVVDGGSARACGCFFGGTGGGAFEGGGIFRGPLGCRAVGCRLYVYLKLLRLSNSMDLFVRS